MSRVFCHVELVPRETIPDHGVDRIPILRDGRVQQQVQVVAGGEVRAVGSTETRQWCSRESTAWTVVYEADARFQISCLNRFIYLKGVTDLKTALENADSLRGQVSTVGIAAPEDVASELAAQLARWGVTRVCPLGQMQNPPLSWRHDGRPALGDLVTWTDYESEF